MVLEEETQLETEALGKLHAALGPDKKLLEGFTLVSAKRRKTNFSSATGSDTVEAGAATAAMVEAAAKESAAVQAAADAEKNKSPKG